MLKRPHRQVLATLALVGFTVVPSAYVAYAAHHVRRPAHLTEVEAEVGRRLGVLVKVARVHHPRPDVDQLEEVSLRHDASDRSEMAHADTLRVTRGSEEMNLRVDRLSLRGGEPSDLLGHVVSILRRVASTEGQKISLVADQARIQLGTRRESVRDLAAILNVNRESPTLTASYRLEGAEGSMGTRCELVLSRKIGPDGIETRVVLKTMEGEIPASTLTAFFDAKSWLGESARMSGTLTLTRVEGRDWEAEFQGDFSDVDLASVVGRRFAGHRLNGRARIAFAKARWSERDHGQGSGWVEARGTLSSGPGSISTSLLQALETRMNFRLGRAIDRLQPDVDFQGLGLQFSMDSGGELKLAGALGADYAPDAVLVQGPKPTPLARAPQGVASIRGLWNTLIPSTPESLAPAVSEAHALRSLPLPPAARSPLSAN